jgi:predicted ATPase
VGAAMARSSEQQQMAQLKKISIKGYRSIKDTSLELSPLNVLIGANGAGKSNFVSFFKMLNEMMGNRLQQYIGTSGRAQSLLYFGPKVTPQLEGELEFEVENGRDWYSLRLFHAAGDTLVFAEETLRYTFRRATRVQESCHSARGIKKLASETKRIGGIRLSR